MLDLIKNRHKVLGINARNLRFTHPANTKTASKLALNKLMTKGKLEEESLPVAKLFGAIRNRKELLNFPWHNLPDSFVLKPNFGFGGEGILLVYGKKKNDNWITTQNQELTVHDIMSHASNILDGNYSMHNVADVAVFEERLKVSPFFKHLAYKGIPDIRVIVYNQVPLMAMLRLPTKASGGKANVHQGGLGLGIDLATGITTHAVSGNKLITHHPETGQALSGIKIPNWSEILRVSVYGANALKLGYAGVDIAIDKEKGPVILEVNSHPGLAIQIANLTGLRERLERVKDLKITSSEKGIKMARSLFGGEVEQEIEEKSGRHIIGLVESVIIKGKQSREKTISAKIDTGADFTAIDIGLAKELGFEEAITLFENENIPQDLSKKDALELKNGLSAKLSSANTDIRDLAIVKSSHGRTLRIKIPITIMLDNETLSTQASVTDRSQMKYPLIVGKKNLKKFLVDPTKK